MQKTKSAWLKPISALLFLGNLLFGFVLIWAALHQAYIQYGNDGLTAPLLGRLIIRLYLIFFGLAVFISLCAGHDLRLHWAKRKFKMLVGIALLCLIAHKLL